MVVSVNEVNEGISRLECNKACGLDGVSAEHPKHCSMCINGFMVHGFFTFLPELMMSVVLIPMIKDKKAKISSIDNCRPVAIQILLDRLSEYLDTMGNQFGFKPGAKTIKKNTNSTQNKSQTHRAKQYEVTSFLSTDCELSTETCSKNVYSLGPRIWWMLLKLLIGSNTLMLFTKLLKRGTPGYIVRLLLFWYAHQAMCIRWGSSVSSKFTVSNGVRQVGILSLFLFNILYGRSVC